MAVVPTISARPLRVVQVTTVHSPFDVRIFHRQCKSLARAGHDVIEIAPAPSDSVVDGVHIEGIPPNEFRLFRIITGPWRAYRKMLHRSADIYHFHDPELLLVGWLLAMQGRRVIYDSHENVPAFISQKEWLPRFLRPIAAWAIGRLEYMAVQRLAGVVAADEVIAERLGQLNSRVLLVRNFPLLDEFPSELANDEKRFRSGMIANLGGLTEERVIREVTTALSLIPAEVRVKMILGGVTYPATLRSELESMPGWQRVDYRGVVPRQKMLSILQQVAVAIVLYSCQPNNAHVRSNRLFEAMAAGLPVIVPDFPEWKKLIEDTGCGVAVNPHDPQSIASGIGFVVSHPEEAREMGKRGRRLFERQFNWRPEEMRLLEFYDRVAGQGRET